MRRVLCDVEMNGLTKIPAVNAPNVLEIETCWEDEGVIPWL